MARTERGTIGWASIILLAAIAVVAAFSATASPAWASTFTVANLDDSGPGSLRQAITDANSTSGEDMITFSPGVESTRVDSAIQLQSPLPQLSSVQIEGPGAHKVTVKPHRRVGDQSTGQFRVFTVGAGTTVSIDGLTIDDARVPSGDGGAVFNAGTLKVTNSTVSGSIAGTSGGGIFNSGSLTIADSAVCNNLASGAGGGIYNAGSGTLRVVDTTVCDNEGLQDGGGGIYNAEGGTLTVESSTLSGNAASLHGGGVFNAATMKVTNSTVSGNGLHDVEGPIAGGGIYTAGDADIESSTITSNSGGVFSGGVFIEGEASFRNSIVAGNRNSGDVEGNFTDDGFNLIGGRPMLGDLQDNGGPNKTHLPLAGSPAIDQGSSKGASPTDERGVQRLQDDPLVGNAGSGDGSDIGAVEVKVPKASIGDVSVAEGSGGTTSADFTVELSESEVSPRTVRFDYSTQDDEATSPADYSSATGTLEFTSRGEALSKTVTVAVQGDALDEPTEGLFLNLSGRMLPEYVADGSALGTIRDDDGPPALSVSDAAATEPKSGTANAAFEVSLSTPSGKGVSVEYATSDGTATVASGDYSETSGTLYFHPGTLSKSVSVPVNSDANSEPEENFLLSLSDPENATIADDEAEGTITDTAPANGAPTASADSYSTDQDKTLRVAAPGLLANDSDPEGDALTAAEVTDPTHGEVFVRADGSFAYFPDDGYLGADSFTYKASDGSAKSDLVTVEITVRDVTAPTVTATNPASGATGTSPRANVTATFSEAIRAGSVNNAFKLYPKGSTTALAATVTYDAATRKAVLNPSANLKRGATYKAVVSAGAQDLAGNALDQNPSLSGDQEKVWSFKVRR